MDLNGYGALITNNSALASIVHNFACVRWLSGLVGVVQKDETHKSVLNAVFYSMRQLYHPMCPPPTDCLANIQEKLGVDREPIDRVLERLLKRLSHEEYRRGVKTRIFGDFVRGVQGEVIRCKSCGLLTETRAPLYILNLGKVRGNNIERCLLNFFMAKEVKGYRCRAEKCRRRKQKAQKWVTVQIMPRLVPICIANRSQEAQQYYTSFPMEINMTRFVRSLFDMNLNVPRIRYRLHGIIEETRSVSGATCKSYVRIEDGNVTKWFECYENFAIETTWEVVKHRNASVLFYECLDWDVACMFYETYLRLYEKRDFL